MDNSDWTLEALKQHLDSRLVEIDRRISDGDERMRDNTERERNQVLLALDSVDKRFADAEGHTQERISALRDAVAIAQAASKEAILKAEAASERRFESVNEFRQQLSDQTSTFLSREVYDAKHSELETRFRIMEENVIRSTGVANERKERQDAVRPWMVWVAGAALGFVVLAINIVVAVV